MDEGERMSAPFPGPLESSPDCLGLHVCGRGHFPAGKK